MQKKTLLFFLRSDYLFKCNFLKSRLFFTVLPGVAVCRLASTLNGTVVVVTYPCQCSSFIT